jgi:hypothetical protein|tara:strand:+ start:168 stop:416 length:249 start_codon:yes stop_codon:yes gene_type:complete
MGKIFREGMEVPQDIDGGSAKPKKPKETKKPKKRAPKVELPPLRKGQVDMPSDPDDGSVGLKDGGMVRGYGKARGGRAFKLY